MITGMQTSVTKLRSEWTKDALFATADVTPLDAPLLMPAGSHERIKAATIPGYFYGLPTVFNRG